MQQKNTIEIAAANDEVFSKGRSRTLPILETMSYVPNYPDKLRIYLTNASSYWQARCYHQGKTHTRSMRTTDKKRAFLHARLFYEELVSSDIVARYAAKHSAALPNLFKTLTLKVLELESAKVKRGELSKKSLEITRYRLDKSVLPSFGMMPVGQISYLHLSNYASKLSSQGLTGVVVDMYLIIIRKVLNYAVLTNMITHLPPFPKIKSQRIPRGAFTVNEYHQLLQTAWRMRGKAYEIKTRTMQMKVKGAEGKEVVMPVEMTRLIGFMVNSFVRPSDVKLIQHKHVEIIRGENTYLRLTLPETKKHDKPIVTMRAAVGIYQRLAADAKKNGYGKPDDYVFFPYLKSRRDHALRMMGFLFNWVLSESGLSKGLKGLKRTLYSLRHSAITLRLLDGQGIDLLTLARNARTSVDMVERFYASALNGEMNIDMLQSKRKKP